MIQLICILASLIIGYSFKKTPLSITILNKVLTYAVISLLFVMGYNFGSEPNFLTDILQTGKIVTAVVSTLFITNLLVITIYSKIKSNNQLIIQNQQKNTKLYHYIFESCRYLVYILLGILIGYIVHIKLLHLEFIINAILFILLFVIGIQLRQQNISLKAILLNKTGLIIAILITLASLTAGVIAAFILNISINTGLVLASGFGWYSLSGILSGQLINPQMGAASFFIDFLREVIAIIIIPSLGRSIPLFCVGYSGATALDLTLPIIKINLGEEAAAIGITSGMLLTILVPILIPIVWNLKL